MHNAKLERSERLQAVYRVLRLAKKGISSWELAQASQTVAVGTCVSELRQQGHRIDCKREGHIWRYTLVTQA